MDYNIVALRTYSITSEIVFEERVHGHRRRIIKKNIYEMAEKVKKNGVSYECFNFELRPDGSCWFNCKEYETIEALLERKSRAAKRSIDDRMKEIDAIISQVKLIAENANSQIKTITSNDGKVYVLDDIARNEVTLFVPSNVDSTMGITWGSNAEYDKITVIGGGPDLRDISFLFKGKYAHKLDVTKFIVDNIEEANGLFEQSYIDRLSLEWLNGVPLKDASDMFYKTECKKIALSNIELSCLESTVRMFNNCKAELFGNIYAPNIYNAYAMFSGYGEVGIRTDLSWLNINEIKHKKHIFDMCKADIVGLRL